MSKVVLTREQAELVEKIKNLAGYESILSVPMGAIKSAFVHGYEIKQPKIDTGDWVKIKELFTPVFNDGRNEEAYKLERIFKVKEVFLSGKVLCPDHYVHYPENLCHATKEEVFWAELGRDIGKFKDGDLLIDKENHVWSVDTSNSTGISSKQMYFKGKLKGFYLPESFKPFPIGNES